MPTERAEYVVPRSTLHHRVPVPLPVVRTPLLHSLDADGWGPRSQRNGRSLVQWRLLRPGTHCLRALRRRTPLPMRVRCALPISPLPGEAHGPPCCRQVKSIQEQIHPTETTKLFISFEMKSLSRVRLFVTPWTVAYQAPPYMEFSRQEYWSGLPFPSPRELPNPGIEPRSPALHADALPFEPPGKPPR